MTPEQFLCYSHDINLILGVFILPVTWILLIELCGGIVYVIMAFIVSFFTIDPGMPWVLFPWHVMIMIYVWPLYVICPMVFSTKIGLFLYARVISFCCFIYNLIHGHLDMIYVLDWFVFYITIGAIVSLITMIIKRKEDLKYKFIISILLLWPLYIILVIKGEEDEF